MTEAKDRPKGRMAKKAKKKVRRTVWVGVDPELAATLQEAEQRVKRQETSIQVRGSEATAADRTLLETLRDRVEELRNEIKSTATPFVFEAIGHNRYDKLIKAHPPSSEQIEAAKKENTEIGFNPETFPFALIDASCVEPAFEPGELATWLEDDEDGEWNQAEINDLFNGAMAVNLSHARANLGKDSLQIPSFEPS